MASKNIINKCAVVFASFIFISSAHAAGSISLMYGNNSLSKSDWEPLESQTGYGMGFEYKEPDWTASFVISYLTSEKSDSLNIYYPFPINGTYYTKITGGTTELAFGARAYKPLNGAKVFIEGGLANITATLEVSLPAYPLSTSDSESTIGLWFGGGLDYSVRKDISIGGLLRISTGSVDFSGVSVDVGGTHLNIFASYHFQ